jgi:hypothetical protein
MGGERLDTRNPTSALMLTILGGVATWEREIMLERQREGIAKAKAEGKYKGRKPTVAVQAEQIRAMRAAGEKPAHIARRLGLARSNVYRMLEGAGGATGGLPAAAAGGSRLTGDMRDRRARRCAAEPSRANSIRSRRDSLSRKPGRIIDQAESPQQRMASDFSEFSAESGIDRFYTASGIAYGRPDDLARYRHGDHNASRIFAALERG